ncbi:hypothetical protein MJO28_004591 [Puccinia striiformis f. sp. tritici]|uniref:Uncharacterized protein n=1 Tax=Puccinia striiformis f. sp. tritici TaxID=168172 RepID=A0ACC0EQ92_9BASI|nr:hypothetical protein MJO28_004591 [Puccinia striiformis f. sp. tritici]KAI7963155.1 hypothetical protein MJO29_003582 [Puccinia striiformis f. sp. tritici]
MRICSRIRRRSRYYSEKFKLDYLIKYPRSSQTIYPTDSDSKVSTDQELLPMDSSTLTNKNNTNSHYLQMNQKVLTGLVLPLTSD